MHREEALRRGLILDVVESPQGTPPTVLGDRGKVKNIIANVVANAGECYMHMRSLFSHLAYC